MRSPTTDPQALWELGLRSIESLETPEGILASGREELYGCLFGRDSLISSLSFLGVYEKTKNPYFLQLVAKILRTLAALQGKGVVIESGEEPGKIIHEYRPLGHEHLTQKLDPPWYVYPDNIMRNYDSVDATPLFLMAMHEYLRVSEDKQFVGSLEPSVRAALCWLLEYGDTNGDGFIDYRFHPKRTYGGLHTQSWMDSTESIFYEEGDVRPKYPIAPVEVQAYAYVALRAWSDYYRVHDADFSARLAKRATELKKLFNDRFVVRKAGRVRFAYALDGSGEPLLAMRSSFGHVLFAVYRGETTDCVLEARYIPLLVARLTARDLFVPRGGIRTLSSRSKKFDPMSYHNGTIWPHDTQMIAEGLRNFGYIKEADKVQQGLLSAYARFNSPVELFAASRGKVRPYESASGQKACKTQAWSAASLLAALLDSAIDAIKNTA